MYPNELIRIRARSVRVLQPVSAANVCAVSHTGYMVCLPYTSRISTVNVLSDVWVMSFLPYEVRPASDASHDVHDDE